jgi:GGDEF domain-containing protein
MSMNSLQSTCFLVFYHVSFLAHSEAVLVFSEAILILTGLLSVIVYRVSWTEKTVNDREAGGELFVGKSLIAFDTDHIKGYVFGTDRLKEIRGASSRLDYLNRITMKALGDQLGARCVYANGGSGLFVIDSDKADAFGMEVQEAYHRETGGTGSITWVVQKLPDDFVQDQDEDIKPFLDLLSWKIREAKGVGAETVALLSHPFLRPCASCGVEYAHDYDRHAGPDERDLLFCASCLQKREEDMRVKRRIDTLLGPKAKSTALEDTLWDRVIEELRKRNYKFFDWAERPSDFNEFTSFRGAKNYYGLIYADANSMGNIFDRPAYGRLSIRKRIAKGVDDSVYEAVADAIARYLKMEDHLKPGTRWSKENPPPFPFDILLLGGDDIMIVVPATVALDVALFISEKFHELTKPVDPLGIGYTLSVGVVLAPVKYPFGLLRKLAESTLKFAKKEGAKRRGAEDVNGITLINFLIVTGGVPHEFKATYKEVFYNKQEKTGEKFYATLRPYSPEHLSALLKMIRDGKEKELGRTKLHQLREAVLKKNLTTSVLDGRMALRNWKDRQRSFVVPLVYAFAALYQELHSNPQNLSSLFPHVTFPWFADGKDRYRTPLLDFVELYDFVSQEEHELMREEATGGNED